MKAGRFIHDKVYGRDHRGAYRGSKGVYGMGGEIAIYILGLLAKGLILLSTPVWILPYILIRDILRDNNGGKCEKPDCDSCPFPPCQKGEGEQ